MAAAPLDIGAGERSGGRGPTSLGEYVATGTARVHWTDGCWDAETGEPVPGDDGGPFRAVHDVPAAAVGRIRSAPLPVRPRHASSAHLARDAPPARRRRAAAGQLSRLVEDGEGARPTPATSAPAAIAITGTPVELRGSTLHDPAAPRTPDAKVKSRRAALALLRRAGFARPRYAGKARGAARGARYYVSSTSSELPCSRSVRVKRGPLRPAGMWGTSEPMSLRSSPRTSRAATPCSDCGAVAVGRVVGRQDRHRAAQAGAGEQRRLVVDLARHAAAPTALEGDPPAARDAARSPSAAPVITPRSSPIAYARWRCGTSRSMRRKNRAWSSAVILDLPRTGWGRSPASPRARQRDQRRQRPSRTASAAPLSSAGSSGPAARAPPPQRPAAHAARRR